MCKMLQHHLSCGATPLQSIILLLGGLISVIAILIKVPGGIGAVVAEGHRHNKLSLGRAEWSWEERTVPTVLTYAAVHYMTKFITFQDAVQRYLAVPSHKVHLNVPCVKPPTQQDCAVCTVTVSCHKAWSNSSSPSSPAQTHFSSCGDNTDGLKLRHLECLVAGVAEGHELDRWPSAAHLGALLLHRDLPVGFLQSLPGPPGCQPAARRCFP